MSKRNKGSHGIYSLTCISRKCGKRFKVIYDTQLVGFEARALTPQEKWHCEMSAQGLGPPPPLVAKRVRLTYPFTGCPFCGTWWPTGPLDGEAYPKRPKSVHISGPALSSIERQLLIDALLRDQAKARSRTSQLNWWDTKWTW